MSMIKLFCVISIILSFGISADILECEFQETGIEINFIQISGYTCDIKYIGVGSPNVIRVNHNRGKIDSDVKIISQATFGSVFDGNIPSVIPTICQKFRNLNGIQIRNAKTETINEHLLWSCQNLIYFDLYNNKISQITENSLNRHPFMKMLSFAKNKLTILPENVFKNQKELTFLSLAENQIKSLPPNIFKSLTKLDTLRLDENQIQNLNPTWFQNLQNLERLNLYKNLISELPKSTFSSLVNLKEIYLYKNHLKIIHSDSFGIHKKLEKAYFWDNIIDAFDERFIDNTAVSEIDMGYNICAKELIKDRSVIKEKLKTCFENYRPRQEYSRPSPPLNINIFLPKTDRPLLQITSNTCGRSTFGQGNIVGGAFITRGAFPWIAALVKSKGDFFCGGTIVSERKIVTAAHCIQEKHSPSQLLPRDIKALLGVHDLNERFEVGIKVSVVRSIHVHPDWNPIAQSFDADIAVLVLEEKVVFDNYIQPICLITPGFNIEIVISGVVVGFGKSENDKKVHENVPKVIDTPIHNNEECFLKYFELAKLSSKRTFCGGHGNGVGVCSGDSGSGLVVQYQGTYYLRGIVSSSLRGYQYGCDVDSYSVFTNVLAYNDWVNKIDANQNFYETRLEIDRGLIWA